MNALRAAALVVLVLAAVAGCSSDDSADGSTTTGVPTETEGSGTTGEDEPADEGGSEDAADAADGGTATATASDGSTWEFTEILECEIGADGSPDSRTLIATTADGSAQLDVSYFPEPELASLSGVSVEAEVDGNDWTYADSYAGSGEAFDISLRPDGAEGSAPVRVAGIEAPDADLTLDWSFTC